MCAMTFLILFIGLFVASLSQNNECDELIGKNATYFESNGASGYELFYENGTLIDYDSNGDGPYIGQYNIQWNAKSHLCEIEFGEGGNVKQCLSYTATSNPLGGNGCKSAINSTKCVDCNDQSPQDLIYIAIEIQGEIK